MTSTCLFISNSLETHVVRTCCSSRAGLALCALSAPCFVVNHFLFPIYLHYEIWELQAFLSDLLSSPLTQSVPFKIVIEIDSRPISLKPTCIEFIFLLHISTVIVKCNIYWELPFGFLCCNYSQEILSNALSDYTKYKMGRNCLVLQGHWHSSCKCKASSFRIRDFVDFLLYYFLVKHML